MEAIRIPFIRRQVRCSKQRSNPYHIIWHISIFVETVQNGKVPEYVVPPLPPEVETALTMLGINQLRSAILLHLAQHPEGATSGDIGRELDADYRTVWRYLKELESQGGVTSEEAEGKGQSPRWRNYKLNVAARDAAIRTYLDFLDGK